MKTFMVRDDGKVFNAKTGKRAIQPFLWVKAMRPLLWTKTNAPIGDFYSSYVEFSMFMLLKGTGEKNQVEHANRIASFPYVERIDGDIDKPIMSVLLSGKITSPEAQGILVDKICEGLEFDAKQISKLKETPSRFTKKWLEMTTAGRVAFEDIPLVINMMDSVAMLDGIKITKEITEFCCTENKLDGVRVTSMLASKGNAGPLLNGMLYRVAVVEEGDNQPDLREKIIDLLDGHGKLQAYAKKMFYDPKSTLRGVTEFFSYAEIKENPELKRQMLEMGLAPALVA